MGLSVSQLIQVSRMMREKARGRCLEMYASGMSYAKIAQETTININTVRAWVTSAGIARAQKEAQRTFIKEYNARRQR